MNVLPPSICRWLMSTVAILAVGCDRPAASDVLDAASAGAASAGAASAGAASAGAASAVAASAVAASAGDGAVAGTGDTSADATSLPPMPDYELLVVPTSPRTRDGAYLAEDGTVLINRGGLGPRFTPSLWRPGAAELEPIPPVDRFSRSIASPRSGRSRTRSSRRASVSIAPHRATGSAATARRRNHAARRGSAGGSQRPLPVSHSLSMPTARRRRLDRCPAASGSPR